MASEVIRDLTIRIGLKQVGPNTLTPPDLTAFKAAIHDAQRLASMPMPQHPQAQPFEKLQGMPQLDFGRIDTTQITTPLQAAQVEIKKTTTTFDELKAKTIATHSPIVAMANSYDDAAVTVTSRSAAIEQSTRGATRSVQQLSSSFRGIRIAQNLKEAGDGAFQLARGIAFVTSSSDEGFRQMLEKILVVQGSFDLFRGGHKVIKNVGEATKNLGGIFTKAAGSAAVVAGGMSSIAASASSATTATSAAAASTTSAGAAASTATVAWAPLAAITGAAAVALFGVASAWRFVRETFGSKEIKEVTTDLEKTAQSSVSLTQITSRMNDQFGAAGALHGDLQKINDIISERAKLLGQELPLAERLAKLTQDRAQSEKVILTAEERALDDVRQRERARQAQLELEARAKKPEAPDTFFRAVGEFLSYPFGRTPADTVEATAKEYRAPTLDLLRETQLVQEQTSLALAERAKQEQESKIHLLQDEARLREDNLQKAQTALDVAKQQVMSEQERIRGGAASFAKLDTEEQRHMLQLAERARAQGFGGLSQQEIGQLSHILPSLTREELTSRGRTALEGTALGDLLGTGERDAAQRQKDELARAVQEQFGSSEEGKALQEVVDQMKRLSDENAAKLADEKLLLADIVQQTIDHRRAIDDLKMTLANATK